MPLISAITIMTPVAIEVVVHMLLLNQNRSIIYGNYFKPRLRFLCPDNLVPFLAARAIFLNVRAAIREQRRKYDNTMKEFRNFVGGKWICTCARCESKY